MRLTALLLIVAVAVPAGGFSRGVQAAGGGPPAMRVVSLAPALTQMVVDVGKGDLLVGVAQHDRAVAGLPVVGHWQDIDSELLLSLRPTHVLTMAGKHAAPPPLLTKLAASCGFKLLVYRLPTRVSEVSEIIFDRHGPTQADNGPSPPCLGVALNASDRAEQLAKRILIELSRVRAATAGLPKPRVLMVIGVNPLMASGPGTVHDELLSYCGARNAAGNAMVGAPVYDKERLLAANPGVVLFLLPHAAMLGSIDTDPRLALFRGLPIDAVKEGRVALVDDPQVLLTSSGVGRIAMAMAKAIHPGLGSVLVPIPLSHPRLESR